ncbi:MAG: TetR/AcrR family transcriptional regulator C-terminal domain-containing protein [Ornithinibacter sp.]
MTTTANTDRDARTPLSAARVLDGAIPLADRIGIEKLTIRRLADELGVTPMAIYRYMPSKEAIIDGMVEAVFTEIDLPPVEDDWKTAMRRRCVSMHEVLLRHPWAPPLMESRPAPGPALLHHHDAVLGCLRRGGLPLPWAAHAYAVLDSYVYGYAMQEANLPFGGDQEIGDLADVILSAIPADQYPYLREFTADHALQPGYHFGNSFDVGLDLLLYGLSTAAATQPGPH